MCNEQSLMDYINFPASPCIWGDKPRCKFPKEDTPEKKASLEFIYNSDSIVSAFTESNGKESLTLGNEFFHQHHCCSAADSWHSEILNPNSEYYRRGYVLIVEDIILGHVKVKGDRNFLSWCTIKKGSEYPLLFGELCAMTEKLYINFREKFEGEEPLTKGKWGIITLDSILLAPRRFILESKDKALEGNSIRERIRRERNLFYKGEF